MPNSSRPIVIFDFDGTIADSLQLVIEEYNQIAALYRAKRVDPADLPRLRKLKAGPVLREHNISFWKLPLLVSHMRFAMHRRVAALQPFDGIVTAIRSLHAAGVHCHILSTNSNANIERFLRRHELRVFDQIAGGTSMFGKARALKKLVARQRWPAERVVYIGDEARDIEAAHAAHIRAVGVSWGYADHSALAAHNPWRLAEQPGQLPEMLIDR